MRWGLRSARINAGYTQSFIAKRLKVERSTYCAAEVGKTNLSMGRWIELMNELRVRNIKEIVERYNYNYNKCEFIGEFGTVIKYNPSK